MYPNEVELQWSVLIVLYPFMTGLVAGAFILASLERVFQVEAVKPTYRLALLTALAFLLVAPMPLQLHLGHPERSFEMYLTPHRSSAMAMFGFVYLWYLLAVLVVEIWLDYRRDIVVLSQITTGWKRVIYRMLTLGSTNVSPHALYIDERAGWLVTVIGIPSAFLLHGYVGFIFGSVKANPWWSSPLMPVVFLFSAMVSGIAAVMLLYMLLNWLRREPIDMRCVDTVARYLFYTFIIDFSLEMLDLIHRIYEADESFRSLDFMVHTRLYSSHIVVQILLGTWSRSYSWRLTQVAEAHRSRPQANLRARRLPDADRHLRHAMECGHRRAALFEKLPRIHDLQDGFCREGRLAHGNHTDNSSIHISLGFSEAPAAVAGESFVCQSGIGAVVQPQVFWPQWVAVMDLLSETLARVCRRLEQLEDRVSAIEHTPQPTIPLSGPQRRCTSSSPWRRECNRLFTPAIADSQLAVCRQPEASPNRFP